ncbi:MAG: Uma2 family endonuclease [Bryobacteraceae bacterium]
MSREEFLGRWDLLPDLKRAELIRGVVHMPSPLGASHGEQDNYAAMWIGWYAANTTGCQPMNNASWLILGSVPQPDVSLRILPDYGGRSGQRGALAAGVPELVVEVSVSSESFDLGEKKSFYEEAGVLEYIVVVAGSRVAWHRLEAGRYIDVPADADGIHRSQIFPGLWLDPKALLAGDGRRLIDVLNQGLATPEHTAFVEKLAGQKRRDG